MEPSTGLRVIATSDQEMSMNPFKFNGTAIIAHVPAGRRKQSLRLHGVKTAKTISMIVEPVRILHGL
jgi:hypothetical protein